VVDYACGPARYIKYASEAIGPEGKLIAVDIHPLAIKKADAKIKKYGLKNVETILAEGYSCSLNNEIANIIYCLDTFHMIPDTNTFLQELSRILKQDGTLILEDGHQSREQTINKINEFGALNMIEETKLHVKCTKKL
jgi:ubiquinone/menaquinone biosynthesis C-methylase UbiE